MTRYVMMTIVFLLASTSAFAQDERPFEVAGGYLSVGGTMHGWSAEVSKAITPHLAVLFEVDRSTGADCAGCEPVYHDQSQYEGLSIFPRVTVGAVIRLGGGR